MTKKELYSVLNEDVKYRVVKLFARTIREKYMNYGPFSDLFIILQDTRFSDILYIFRVTSIKGERPAVQSLHLPIPEKYLYPGPKGGQALTDKKPVYMM